MTGARTIRVEVEGTAVPVEVTGEGRGVLLLAGGASTCFGYFPRLAGLLGADMAVITHDRPGVGRLRDTHPLSLAKSATQVAEVVRATGLGPVVAVGHSLGALIALRLAVDHPDQVAGLVLLEPTPTTPAAASTALSTGLRLMGALGPLSSALWLRRARHDLGSAPFDDEQQAALAVYTDKSFTKQAARWAGSLGQEVTDLNNAVAQVPVPVVVVSAGANKPGGPQSADHKRLATALPHGRLEVWEETTHPLHMQRPDRVADAVRGLARH